MRKVTLSLVWVTSFNQQEKTKSSSNTNIQQKLRVLLLCREGQDQPLIDQLWVMTHALL
jgi:hypothetical protein